MNKSARILFGVTTKSHIEIALDEMYGLQELGYTCDQFEFGGKKNFKSLFARFYVILANTIKLLVKTYQFKPNFIYLNSRLEFVAGVRDFITIIFLKLFYYKKVHFLIKSHGSDLEVLQTDKFFFKRMVFPFLKRNVRAWLFLSKEELTWIVSNNLLNNERLFLAKNIVRLEKFNIDLLFRQKLNIPKEDKILLFVGRMFNEKGIHYVVDAFAEIKDKYKVFLIIVGDGEEFTNIQAKINSLNMSNVLITGWIEESEVAYYTSNGDVLIFPTFFPEGFPMALFNSLAAGLSIITTPTRAASDYLKEPENCLWVEPKSSASIVDALDKLLVDSALMEQMSKNNKEKSQMFTKRVVAHELSDILDSIKAGRYDKSFMEVKKERPELRDPEGL